MTSLLNILWNPVTTLKELGKEYSDDLHRKSIWIIVAYSVIISILNDVQNTSEAVFLVQIGGLCLGIAITLFFVFALSSVIYWIGNTIVGKAAFTEIEATVAYSLIPTLFGFIVVVFINEMDWNLFDWNKSHFINSISFLGWIASTNIVYQGVKLFNQFNWKQTLLAMLPLLLLYVVILALIFYVFSWS
ncbi:MAG: YIP1 family protein [Chitinophagales bacterium]